jgi:hypothetical protein
LNQVWQQIPEADVQTLAAMGGQLFILTKSGDLWRYAPNSTLRERIDTNVREFSLDADGALNVLTRDGKAFRNGVFLGYTHQVTTLIPGTNTLISVTVFDGPGSGQVSATRGVTGVEPLGSRPVTDIVVPWGAIDKNNLAYWTTPQGMAESATKAFQKLIEYVKRDNLSLIPAGSIAAVSGAGTGAIAAAVAETFLQNRAFDVLGENLNAPPESFQLSWNALEIALRGANWKGLLELATNPIVINDTMDKLASFAQESYNKLAQPPRPPFAGSTVWGYLEGNLTYIEFQTNGVAIMSRYDNSGRAYAPLRGTWQLSGQEIMCSNRSPILTWRSCRWRMSL